MSRRRLAAVLRKKFKMGCVGIFSYDGAEVHYKKLMRLVEEATEQYQQVALLQTGGEAKETFSTTHDPQTSDSDNSSIGDGAEDDESSVPDPGNTLATGAEVMETPWKIFFKQSPHDITGSRNERAEDGKNDELQTIPSSGGGVECLTNQNSENDSDVTTVNHLTTKDDTTSSDVGVSVNKEATTFHWNVNATEFKPVFG
jgi:hypothetical protein